MSVHPYIVTALSTFMLYENSSHLHQLCTLGILKNVSNISGLHLFLELEATGALQLKPYHSIVRYRLKETLLNLCHLYTSSSTLKVMKMNKIHLLLR